MIDDPLWSVFYVEIILNKQKFRSYAYKQAFLISTRKDIIIAKITQ